MKQSHTTTVGNETAPASRLPLETGKAVLVGVAYYATAWLSLRVALVGHQVTPIWPPTGIALVGLLLFGRRVWPGITLAAFLVNAPISHSLLEAAAISAGNTLAPLLSFLLLRTVGFRRELDRLRDAMAIVLLGALVGMTASATVGTSALLLSGTIPLSRFLSTWSVWWTGDAMGVLVIAPLLLSLRTARRGPTSWRRWAEAGTMFGCLTFVTVVVFRSGLQIEYLVFPFLVWAAWRFHQRGAGLAALFTSSIAVWAAEIGIGPFAHGTLLTKMAILQLFNVAVAFTSFMLAAVAQERARDAADRRRGEEAVARLASIVESSSDAIIGKAVDGTILSWNAGAERLYGYTEAEVLGRPISIIVPPDRPAELDGILERIAQGKGIDHLETDRIRKDGSRVPVSLSVSPIFDERGSIIGASSIARDISQRRRMEERLTFLAYHDPLTQLPNRPMFERHLGAAIARAKRRDLAVAVLFMDLDDFKLVNDTMGHLAGDTLLVDVAARLTTVAREADLLARHGGDEFLLLLADLDRRPRDGTPPPREVAESAARRLEAQLEAPFPIDGTEVSVSLSVGICVFPDDARNAGELLMSADTAMYRKKRAVALDVARHRGTSRTAERTG